ncbi:MAG: heparinase II/III family protein [Gaiellaceae bacterium]
MRAGPGLYVHALRTARRRQLVGRVTRVVSRRRFPVAPSRRFRPLTDVEPLWRSRAFAPTEERRPPAPGRLGRFELHYADDVLGLARRGDVAAAAAALHEWIARNPPRHGDPWHPYVVSTRIANWVAAATLLPELAAPEVVESLSRQLAFLERNVEDDVLGNHVIRNAKALVLGGAALDDRTLLEAGRALLARELPEQVLPDGGHYERSPAYHRLVLRDLLEVQPFAPVGPEVQRMTRFASASARPDGAPALFNDGNLDIAPPLELPPAESGTSVFPETGYVFVREGGLWLALDCGPPAPAFLPAHAHADALSIQLWLDGVPVIVDPGTSTYEPGETRRRERSTAAHSTVAIDGRDQFEQWGAFRSGPLPEVILRAADRNRAEAEVRWPTGAVHRRSVRWSSRDAEVEDSVGGAARALESRLTQAPEAVSHATITAGGDVESEPGWTSERFAAPRRSSNLVQRRAGAHAELSWRVATDAV